MHWIVQNYCLFAEEKYARGNACDMFKKDCPWDALVVIIYRMANMKKSTSHVVQKGNSFGVKLLPHSPTMPMLSQGTDNKASTTSKCNGHTSTGKNYGPTPLKRRIQSAVSKQYFYKH